MDDLISRQAAIDALQKEINKGIPPFNDVMGSIRCGVRLARNIIEDLPSAQQWIPCSERLPDQNGKYLVVGRQKAINILKFDGGRWYGKWGVVAWMPLPSPYREETES